MTKIKVGGRSVARITDGSAKAVVDDDGNVTETGHGLSVKKRTPSNIRVSQDGALRGIQPELNFTGEVSVTNDNPNRRVNVAVAGTLAQRVTDLETAFSEGNRFTSQPFYIWTGSGLTFNAIVPAYYIQGVRFDAVNDTKTHAAADPTLPRRDVAAVNDSGVVVIIEGTPAADPVKPTVDPLTQLEITDVLIPAGSLVPGGITNEIAYQDNNEWTVTSDNGTVDPDNTSGSFEGTKNIDVGTFTNGQVIDLTDGTLHNVSDFEKIFYYINLKATFANNTRLTLQLFNSSTPVSSVVAITNGTHNWTRTTINSWQQVVALMSEFSPFTGSQFDKLRITLVGSNSTGFKLDFIVFQTGSAGVSPTFSFFKTIFDNDGNAVNADQSNDNVTFKGVAKTGTKEFTVIPELTSDELAGIQNANDPDIDNPFATLNDLASTIGYLLTEAGAIAGFKRIALSTHDADFGASSDFATPTITGDDILIEDFVTDQGAIDNSIVESNINFIFRVRKTTGIANARFYAEVYHIDSGLTETLIDTTGVSLEISSAIYVTVRLTAFIASLDLTSTDYLGIKLYANKSGVGSNPEFEILLEGLTGPARFIIPIQSGGGGGSGTVNSGTQYRIAYYATAGTAVSEAGAITASRILQSDANGVPTHVDTATYPTLTELSYVKGVTSAIQTQIDAIAGYWRTVPGTPTRTGDYTFTITDTGNANLYDLKFNRGTVLKWTDTTVKQAMVVSATYSSNTVTITIIGDVLNASATMNTFKYALEKAIPKEFAIAGTLADGADLSRIWEADKPYRVFGADAYVHDAGTTNDTTIEILKGGSANSLFTSDITIGSTSLRGYGYTAIDGASLAYQDRCSLSINSSSVTKPVDVYVALFIFPTYNQYL